MCEGRGAEHRRQRPSATTARERTRSLLPGTPTDSAGANGTAHRPVVSPTSPGAPEQTLDGRGRQGRLHEETDRGTRLDEVGEVVLGMGGDQDYLPGFGGRVVEQSSGHREPAFRTEADVEKGHIRTQVSRA